MKVLVLTVRETRFYSLGFKYIKYFITLEISKNYKQNFIIL